MSPRVPEIVLETETACHVRSGPLYVVRTVGQATDVEIDAIDAGLAETASRAGHVALAISTAASARPPDSAARGRILASLGSLGPRLACVAVVVPTSGFEAAILRSAAAALFMLPRHRHPARVFESDEAAAPWIAERARVPREEVAELMSAARMRLALRAVG